LKSNRLFAALKAQHRIALSRVVAVAKHIGLAARRRLHDRDGRCTMRICLAASGGGHLRQLLDLQPVWDDHDVFFITERTALGESLAASHRSYAVTHFAVGQAKLGKPMKMLAGAWRSIRESRSAIRAERPDVLISTGAGAMVFAVLWARLYGAKVILIESFARFDRPSLFMRLAGRLAHRRVIQSAALKPFIPDAELFDPLRLLDGPRPAKLPLLFVTVGATLPFDRMIEAVAELKREGAIPERVIAQVGVGGSVPEGIETVETLPFDRMRALLREADIVICHGGTGSLITALREHCRVISMPRLFALGEHYDDHQQEITSVFERRGLIRTARNLNELRDALQAARSSEPVGATTDPEALANWLRTTLAHWSRT
jgi:UDP-N-acetylglucosamine transferase subunit ALG13